MARMLVTGGGGFIAGHLVNRLVADGHDVVAVDIKPIEDWWQPRNDVLNIDRYDLALSVPERLLGNVNGVFHLAADMGGIGFIESHHLDCSLSTRIDLQLIEWLLRIEHRVDRVVYASSACVYPNYRQSTRYDAPLRESDAYPAMPEDGYGWQKLYTERLMRHVAEDAGIPTRVARLHNVYGPHGSWRDGREKAPAAICRKVASAVINGRSTVDVWGDGQQTRSFMHVDDCVEGLMRIYESSLTQPVNLGSTEQVTIDQLVRIIAEIADADIKIEHVPGPLGVRGRSSDNDFIRSQLGWEPSIRLRDGLVDTYNWIFDKVLESSV